MVLWNRVCPSIFLTFRLSRHFHEIGALVLSKFWHDPRNPYDVLPDRTGIFLKIFFCPKMCQKLGFWNSLKNLVINIYWICFIIKSDSFLCSYTNLIFTKNLFHEIWVKMLPANQTAGHVNQLHFQNKYLK